MRNGCLCITSTAAIAAFACLRFVIRLESMLGNIKPSLAGAFHAFGFQKYAHRYFGQVLCLFSRRFDLRAIRQRQPHAAVGQVLAPCAWFARLSQLAAQVVRWVLLLQPSHSD